MEAQAQERKAEMNRELRERLITLKKERNAIILAHYYQRDEIQEVADFRGDSFLLAQKAASTDAEVIVFCGVHFMGKAPKFWLLIRLYSFPMNVQVVQWPIWSM